MTTGQRIAAKRKEQELSQESLGEMLGVSRQSIYKWESDSSLPEIDKLVAMSRLFGVSVGWLLGVEEEPEAPSNDQLSEAQLKMVEEILARYQQDSRASLSEEQQAQVDKLVAQKLAEQPRKRRKKWPYVLAALAVIWGSWTLLERMERIDQQYNNLASSVNNISHNVNGQINTITNRVEEVLKGINDLTADYGTELVSADLAQNTVTFALRAVPKTYVDGLEVIFLADTGDGNLTELAGEKGPGAEFTAELTCPLTDSITLSAVFVDGTTRQTQLLDNYGGLYSSSLPTDYIDLHFGHLWGTKLSEDGKFHLQETADMVFGASTASVINTKLGQTSIRELKVGLFQNRKLVQWLEPCEKPDNYNTGRDEDTYQFFRHPELALTIEEGDTLHYAVLVTDQYGRTGIVPGVPWVVRQGDELEHQGGDATPYFDLANYTF